MEFKSNFNNIRLVIHNAEYTPIHIFNIDWDFHIRGDKEEKILAYEIRKQLHKRKIS